MIGLLNHKIRDFDLIQANYKYVGDHGIRADILVPKTSVAGKRPTILRFHGGGLVTGDSLSVEFYPNYRLLPETNGLDIYEDIEDFWMWVHSGAVETPLRERTSRTEIDLARILATGESAGGLLGINLALSHAKDIRAATGVYPSLDIRSVDWTTPHTILPMSMDVPEGIVDATLASLTPGSVITSASPPDRTPLLGAGIQHGRLAKMYERGLEGSPQLDLLYPDARLEKEGVELPRRGMVLIQGRQDGVVLARGTERFIEKAHEATKGQAVNNKLILSMQDGEHGFDLDLRYEEEAWLQDALKVAVQTWLEIIE
ncbi:Alpha/Beta hydrolase protein [Aspergillus pseudoustus]|uniref:Alpha/Beta hydrolase protein n=1 Tax=Aspergillus pseudoustus TaxID=1810923 RepID=A0ABR4KJS3_9EURO